MQKIKLLTDSACDIPIEYEKDLDIDILSIPITIDGKGYLERKDFTPQEFYDLQLAAKEIPSTSCITFMEFMEHYQQAYQEGYTNLIHVTICGNGSSIYSAAQIARDMLYKENPEIEKKMKIDIVDSKIYTVAYGYPLMQADKMVKEGVDAQEIVDYLRDFFDRVEVYFSVFTLEFVKKSGRVKSAAAFVGEVLGLRPIICITEGKSEVIEKIRGDKQVVPRLAQFYKELSKPEKTPYMVVHGIDRRPADELAALLTKQLGYPPVMIAPVGASIAINAGPKVVGIIFVGNKRQPK